jgi:hypothetical protein
VKISLHAQAELELVEGAAYYAREANRELGEAFIAESLCQVGRGVSEAWRHMERPC